MKKENLFAHIDNLDDLKPYICPKAVSTRDWEAVCQECKGKCDAGRQAIKILDEATKPDIPKKTGGRGIVTAKMLAGRDAWNELQHERIITLARKVFSEAIRDHRNPCEVLAEIEGTDATTARKRIDFWIKKYSDLDKELNMRTIMDCYVKRRKRGTRVLSEEASDEISIGDILKAADEGRAKTDSVEETESGVEIHAHIESEQVNMEEIEKHLSSDQKAKKAMLDAFLSSTDNVNYPSHYTFGTIETIDYIRDKMTPEMFQGHCMANVLKYVSRHKHKNGVEDLKKAQVYLGWLIESEEAEK